MTSPNAPAPGSVVAILDPDFVFMRPLTKDVDPTMTLISSEVGGTLFLDRDAPSLLVRCI
jgi:hypothetical protein